MIDPVDLTPRNYSSSDRNVERTLINRGLATGAKPYFLFLLTALLTSFKVIVVSFLQPIEFAPQVLNGLNRDTSFASQGVAS